MKILLIYPPWLRLFGLSSRYFPLNLGYLAAELRKRGHDPIIYQADFDIENMNESFVDAENIMTSNHRQYVEILQDLDHTIWGKIRETIEAVQPEVVGITNMTATYGSAINVATCVKRIDKDIKVILGGVHPTILPEETIREPDVDLVVKGEAEKTFVEVIKGIEKKDLSSIGSQYGNGKYVINPMPNSAITDINLLEFPARNLLLNLADFPPNGFGTLMGSRGCPFKCIFCSSHKMWGRKVRFRTGSNIVEEIVAVNETFGTEYFHFEDDTFTLRKDLVMEFCRILKEKSMKVTWSCPTRVDFITSELVKEMKSAGCSSISLGIESGSEDTLKRIGKNVTLDQVRRGVKIIKDEGIRIMGYFVFGFPWETKEHFEVTLDFIEELDLDVVQYNFAVPLPGTELYRLVEREGMLPPHETPLDWSMYYQHSPCLPFPKGAGDKASVMEYIGSRIGGLNRRKAELRRRKFARESRMRRIKHYMRSPSALASRLSRLVVGPE